MRAYYLFGKSPLPTRLNSDINKVLEELSKITDQETYLKAAYEVITTRFTSSRLKTVLRVWDLFSVGVEYIWNRTGFLHCTNQNYLLALLLIKGGFFKEEDVQPKWGRLWLFSPHQHLRVKVGHKFVDVDAWGRSYDVPFGDYAHGFNSKATQTR